MGGEVPEGSSTCGWNRGGIRGTRGGCGIGKRVCDTEGAGLGTARGWKSDAIQAEQSSQG